MAGQPVFSLENLNYSTQAHVASEAAALKSPSAIVDRAAALPSNDRRSEIGHALRGTVYSVVERAESLDQQLSSDTHYEQSTTTDPAAQPDRTAPERVLTRDQQNLVETHSHIVRYIAKKYNSPSMTPDDLVQEGFLALSLAALRFQPERGVAFSTYATRCVAGEIANAVRDRGATVRGFRENPARTRAYHLAIDTLRSSREDVTDEAIMRLSGLNQNDLEKQREVERMRIHVRSIHDPRGSDDMDLGLEDLIADTHQGAEVAQNVTNNVMLYAAIDRLPNEQLKTIIRSRHGLPPYTRRYTQAEIAQLQGVSSQWISRLERHAESLLRKELAEESS